LGPIPKISHYVYVNVPKSKTLLDARILEKGYSTSPRHFSSFTKALDLAKEHRDFQVFFGSGTFYKFLLD
jgi:hypothetical protein